LIRYKINILEALKEARYNTNRLRKEKLLAEGVIQSLREGKYIGLPSIDKICSMLNCQPGDIIEYLPDDVSAPSPAEE
jgi:putative transcriptional regulator